MQAYTKFLIQLLDNEIINWSLNLNFFLYVPRREFYLSFFVSISIDENIINLVLILSNFYMKIYQSNYLFIYI